jgi:hypothetical protein
MTYPSCEAFTPNRPLWQVMHEAVLRAGPSDSTGRRGYAAELRAIADWRVPEEPPYASLFPSERNAIDTAMHSKRAQRQAIRAKLLAEADRAEKGE